MQNDIKKICCALTLCVCLCAAGAAHAAYNYRVSGKVVNQGTSIGVPNASVTLQWTCDNGGKLTASGMSNQLGDFTLSINNVSEDPDNDPMTLSAWKLPRAGSHSWNCNCRL